MNEITRIHLAKTAYDIEIAAKKQLEKYIKSLEAYTQDSDVLADIEIRMTELLAERGVAAGGVISSDDVAAIRKQLGEPYEFADDEGDIAVGSAAEPTGRRLYRSTDNAVLGGVLSGVASYFNVNPLWPRLVFILLLFISFGFASLLYILFWILTPPARTATEKLHMAGKDVTLESIKELNADEEKAPENRVAPVLQRIFSVGLGSLSALSAFGVLALTIWMVVAAITLDDGFMDVTNGFMGLGAESVWLVWVLFWIVLFGLLLLTALFTLVSYAFFARKLTKRMVVSGIVIVVLGVASVATVVGVSTTQSLRVANEARSLMRETKTNLPKEFSQVTSLTFSVKTTKPSEDKYPYFPQYPDIRYVVDEGTPRYELNALPTAKVVTKLDGSKATVVLEIPNSYRNSFVQPTLTVYGPALEALSTGKPAEDANSVRVSYDSLGQALLNIDASHSAAIQTTGSFEKVTVKGDGSVDVSGSAVQALDVRAELGLTVTAGTIRTLTVTQPDVCPSGSYADNTSIQVAGVTSDAILYNGQSLPVETHRTGCASIIVEPEYTDEVTY